MRKDSNEGEENARGEMPKLSDLELTYQDAEAEREEMKPCARCAKPYSPGEFYVSNGSYCKACIKASVIETRARHARKLVAATGYLKRHLAKRQHEAEIAASYQVERGEQQPSPVELRGFDLVFLNGLGMARPKHKPSHWKIG